MAQIRVYSDIIRGFIEYTGNTIQTLNGSSQETQCAIGTGPPGGNFTAQTAWRTNGSAAFLSGLTGSTVVKAYLAWIGTPAPDVNGSASNQNIAITFKTPLGSNSLTGNPAWSQDNNIGSQQFNIRIADVTSLVTAAGLGQYSVEGVPSGINYTGWTLAVVWNNNSLPPRFISVDSYDDLVSTSLSLTVGGFITPLTGAVNGRAAMVIGSAESWTSSGPTAFGPTVAGLVNLTGPNNPTTNFFQMQVNDSNSESTTVGQLDKTGTLGTSNSALNLSAAPTNVRYHWDQTNVSINSGLTNSQTQGVFRFGTVNNPYVVHLLSLQIDVQSPIIESSKTVDKSVSKFGETLTYTCVVKNTGNFATNDLIILDTIPSQTSFVSGSFTVNGTTLPSASPLPPSGVDIGSITLNETKTVTFKVNVISGINTTISNAFTSSYTYTPLANTTLSGSVLSNNADTFLVGVASIPISKTVDKTFANVGDTITYTLNLKNIGTTTATGVTFIDTIPNGTSFIANSLTLNGATQSGASPAPPGGFSIASIGQNIPTTVVFKVKVDTIPNPNPIPNTGFVSFSYAQTSTITQTSNAQSNIVTTQVNNANLGNIVKGVNKSYTVVGDVLTYTITIPNSGNVSANSVVFKDTIPNGTTFVSNSVIINGAPQNGLVVAPPTGLSVGTIPAGGVTTLSFNVIVNTIPSPNPIPNSGNVSYSYILDTVSGTTASGANNTNIVSTTINDAIITSTKISTPTNAVVGNSILYTVILANSGNTTANNVNFIDTIPNGTSFITDSLTLNGTTQTGASPAPPAGFNVGSIAPSGVVTLTFRVNSTTTVVFQITVNTVPNPNPIPNVGFISYNYVIDPIALTNGNGAVNTNIANTQVNYADFGIAGKIVNKTFSNIGDILTYTIVYTNTGNVTANNVIISDTIPNDTAFQPSSVIINNIANTTTVPVGNVLIISAGNVAPNSTATLSFKVKVTTAPSPNPIPNSASSSFTYTVDPALPNGVTSGKNTNIVNTQVNSASLGGITKFVDKAYAICGEIITYTISIPNSGNITATNVVLSDTVPNGTAFVASSILVNGASSSATSPSSIPLGSIAPGDTTTVSFKVIVQC